jgi:thiol-disulfide isomerase/thioredoxin
MPKTIITKIENRTVFLNLLKDNPGIIILKFGASWCKPCKLIETPVYNFFGSSPDNVICGDIDVDDSFDVFSYLKTKKMVSGVPTLLCYKKGNITYIPDDSVSGSDLNNLNAFFIRCVRLVKE